MTNKIFKTIRRHFSALLNSAKPIRASAANKVVYNYIDISEWQGTVDFAKVKASGVQGIIIRIGYGDVISYPYQIDKQFERNYSECKRLGLPVGAYFYCYATTVAEAQREAQGCLKLITGKQFELPILYDVEEQSVFSKGYCNEVIKAFADILETAKWWVGIYSFKCAADAYFTERTKTRYTMAIAQYASVCTYTGPYAIWQNSSTTSVPGISGRVDHDWCYEDFPTEIKAKGKNGYTAPSTDTRIETTQDSDILKGTASSPPVVACVGKGNQYTIDKTVKVGAYTFGHIKGTGDRWINLKTCKTV